MSRRTANSLLLLSLRVAEVRQFLANAAVLRRRQEQALCHVLENSTGFSANGRASALNSAPMFAADRIVYVHSA
jgi:hypothetical protein